MICFQLFIHFVSHIVFLVTTLQINNYREVQQEPPKKEPEQRRQQEDLLGPKLKLLFKITKIKSLIRKEKLLQIQLKVLFKGKYTEFKMQQEEGKEIKIKLKHLPLKQALLILMN